MQKIRVYNYPDDQGIPCVWIGTIEGKKSPSSIVTLRNSKGEMKEDFLVNLQYT